MMHCIELLEEVEQLLDHKAKDSWVMLLRNLSKIHILFVNILKLCAGTGNRMKF